MAGGRSDGAAADGAGARSDGAPAPARSVLAALADPTRWQVLDLLARHGSSTASTLAGELPVSRPAVAKHLAVLARAGLVDSRRRGREVRYTARLERMAETGRWMTDVAAEWDARLGALKRLAETEDADGSLGG